MEHPEIYLACDKLLTELLKFDEEILSLGSVINDDRFRLFEKSIGFNLPLDLKYLLHLYNGFSLMGTGVYGLDDSFRGSSLNNVYHDEHYEADIPMPAHFVPFSPDGAGNHYCLDVARLTDGLCPVVFWQHDAEYLSLKDVEVCNSSFTDWVQEVMIGWTLEDYNYDGSEK